MKSIKFLGMFLLANLFLYGIGSFIAFDWNPMNWLLLTEWVGRVIFLLIEMCLLVNLIKD